jgi:hypothetical protein
MLTLADSEEGWSSLFDQLYNSTSNEVKLNETTDKMNPNLG